MNKLKQHFTNGRRLGDDWWFLIKMAVQGHLLTDEKYQRFIHGLLNIECCDPCENEAVLTVLGLTNESSHNPENCESCETLVRHGFPDTEQVC